MPGERESICEVVGVFHNAEDFEDAVQELQRSGFDRAELSLLASDHAVEKKLKHRYRRVSDIADDPAVPRTAYVSTEAVGDAQGALVGGLIYVGAVGGLVMSGGTLAPAMFAAALAGGTGAIIGSILAHFVGQNHADYLHKQIEHGGLLLWVRAWDPADEAIAISVLRKHGGGDVHSHSYLAAG